MSKMIYVIRESPNCLIAGKHFYFTGTTHLEHRLRKMIKLKKETKSKKNTNKNLICKTKMFETQIFSVNCFIPLRERTAMKTGFSPVVAAVPGSSSA